MNRLRGSLQHLIYNGRVLVAAASGTRFPKIRARRNGRRALVAASGTRFPKIRVRALENNERSHFQKRVMFLGSSSRLVHRPGKTAPELLHGVFSLSEVRLENLTPS